MPCTSYTAGAAPAPTPVTAPVSIGTPTKTGSDETGDLIKVDISVGDGTGTQPALNVTINGVLTTYPRIINAVRTITMHVDFGTKVDICAT